MVEERLVVVVPANLDLKAVAALPCAGITTYSPLRHRGVGPGQKVGIAGPGGLGRMGIKFAKAPGVRVVMTATSPEKGRDFVTDMKSPRRAPPGGSRAEP